MDTRTFEQFLHDAGLRPTDPIVPDGKWHRCPTEEHPRKKNGGWKWAVDGQVGWARDFARHGETLTWWAESGGDTEGVEIDREAIARMKRKRREEAERARVEAGTFYAACDPLVGGHEYLSAKGLTLAGTRGLRVDSDGWLVVPMGKDGRLMTVQRIAPDGSKLFAKGAPTIGARYCLERDRATVTILCEGLATGLALFAAVPTSNVVVAFTASNLSRVAESLDVSGFVAVAGDNDHGTAEKIGENPGEKAAAAAAKILGCGYAMPEGIDGTDWNDYRQERLEVAMRPLYGKPRPRLSAAQAAVDAEISRAIRHASEFLATAKIG